MTIKKLALGPVLLFAFVACGTSSGTVYDKDFIDAHTDYVTVQDYVTIVEYNANTKTYQPTQKWVGSHEEPRQRPACWKVMFKDSGGDAGSDCISEYKWNEIEIGDFYTKGNN